MSAVLTHTSIKKAIVDKFYSDVMHYLENGEYKIESGSGRFRFMSFIVATSHKSVTELDNLRSILTDEFITDDGQRCSEMEAMLVATSNKTVKFVTGEQDSFGPLSAIMVTLKGCISYG